MSLTISALLLAILSLVLMFDQSFKIAFVVATIAMIFDALDGYLARLWSVESPTGAVADTVTDVFLYLLVPITWWWARDIAEWVLMIYFVAGLYRLLRFTRNGYVTINNRQYYQGYPVYCCYILIASKLLFTLPYLLEWLLIIIISTLMASRLPFPKQSLKQYGLGLTIFISIVMLSNYV